MFQDEVGGSIVDAGNCSDFTSAAGACGMQKRHRKFKSDENLWQSSTQPTSCVTLAAAGDDSRKKSNLKQTQQDVTPFLVKHESATASASQQHPMDATDLKTSSFLSRSVDFSELTPQDETAFYNSMLDTSHAKKSVLPWRRKNKQGRFTPTNDVTNVKSTSGLTKAASLTQLDNTGVTTVETSSKANVLKAPNSGCSQDGMQPDAARLPPEKDASNEAGNNTKVGVGNASITLMGSLRSSARKSFGKLRKALRFV